jgi:hypothetical protein
MTATRGLIEYIFGDIRPSWQATGASGTPLPGFPRRKKFGSKQRRTAAAGKPITLLLDTGETFIVRVTGADIDFIDKLLTSTQDRVLAAWTPRGTKYAPQFANV